MKNIAWLLLCMIPAALCGCEQICDDTTYSPPDVDLSPLAEDREPTALMEAAENGNIERVRHLLEQEGDINARSGFGETALLIALDYNNMEIARLLLENGAQAKAKNVIGTTSLMYASDRGHLGMVQILLEKGVDVNALRVDGPLGGEPPSALMLAAANGHVEIVKCLLEHGAEPDIQDSYERTALIWAVKGGHTQVVRELLNRGADVHIRNVNGDTALWYASYRSDVEIARMLIEKGARVNTIGNRHSSDTPLMAASWNGHLSVVRLLLDNGAEINAISSYREETALMLASREGHTEVVRLLLERGADVHAKEAFNGLTALYWAVQKGYREIVELLLSKGAEDQTFAASTTPHNSGKRWRFRTIDAANHEWFKIAYNGSQIVSASENENDVWYLKVWNADTGQLMIPPVKHQGRITSAGFCPDGDYLATSCFDGKVRIIELKTGHIPFPVLDHDDVVTDAFFSPDNKHILTSQGDGQIVIWNYMTSQKTMVPQSAPSFFCGFSPNGKYGLICSIDGDIHLYNLETGEPVKQFKVDDQPYSAALLWEKKQIIVAGLQSVSLWDIVSGHLLHEPWLLNSDTSFPCVSPDGLRVLAVSRTERELTLHDCTGVRIGEPLCSYFDTLAFSPDAKYIMISNGTTIDVLDSHTGNRAFYPLLHDEQVASYTFCMADDSLVSADTAGIIYLWK